MRGRWGVNSERGTERIKCGTGSRVGNSGCEGNFVLRRNLRRSAGRTGNRRMWEEKSGGSSGEGRRWSGDGLAGEGEGEIRRKPELGLVELIGIRGD